jgi:hypothetical protein
MPGGLLRHVETGALCHSVYAPPECGGHLFSHLATTSGPRCPITSVPRRSGGHAWVTPHGAPAAALPGTGPGGGSAGAWPRCRPGPFPEFIDGRGPRRARHVITGLVFNARRSGSRPFLLTAGQVMNKPNGTGWEYRRGCDGNGTVTPCDPFLSRGSGRCGCDLAGQGGEPGRTGPIPGPGRARKLGSRGLTPRPGRLLPGWFRFSGHRFVPPGTADTRSVRYQSAFMVR